jgi:hypothetical protein
MFCNIFSSVFRVLLQVFQKHISSVSSVFRRILQILHLDVSKVDQVLHMGTHVGSGMGHERSPRAVWRHGQRPGGTGDIRGHTVCWRVRVQRVSDRVQCGRPGANTYVSYKGSVVKILDLLLCLICYQVCFILLGSW